MQKGLQYFLIALGALTCVYLFVRYLFPFLIKLVGALLHVAIIIVICAVALLAIVYVGSWLISKFNK